MRVELTVARPVPVATAISAAVIAPPLARASSTMVFTAPRATLREAGAGSGGGEPAGVSATPVLLSGGAGVTPASGGAAVTPASGGDGVTGVGASG
ncbi:MAG TPA: hypothetical protein VG275_06175 [Solirubrobacteraceae bacterium]|nr:hypothetical protein [Solirubrobacteraceae bacterium]